MLKGGRLGKEEVKDAGHNHEFEDSGGLDGKEVEDVQRKDR